MLTQQDIAALWNSVPEQPLVLETHAEVRHYVALTLTRTQEAVLAELRESDPASYTNFIEESVTAVAARLRYHLYEYFDHQL